MEKFIENHTLYGVLYNISMKKIYERVNKTVATLAEFRNQISISLWINSLISLFIFYWGKRFSGNKRERKKNFIPVLNTKYFPKQFFIQYFTLGRKKSENFFVVVAGF